MRKYTAEQRTENRLFITFDEKNSRGETIQAEIIRTETPSGKNSLPYLWKKNGFIKKVLPSYFMIETYATDGAGNCRGLYNPQRLPGVNKIDFDFMLEATEENREKLIAEIERRAFNPERTEQDDEKRKNEYIYNLLLQKFLTFGERRRFEKMKDILKEYAEKYGATITKDENGGSVALFYQATAGERLKAFENFFTAISKYIDAKSGLYGDKIAVYLSI